MSVFRYSRWDGTQHVMPFDADSIMEAISEDVLAHGDLRRALEKLMQQGYKFQSGERMPGLRDLLDRLKQQRQEMLKRNNMDSVIKDIQERLERVKETERAGIERRVEEGRQALEEKAEGRTQREEGGEQNEQYDPEQDRMMQRMLEKLAERRREQLDTLPRDIGEQIKA